MEKNREALTDRALGAAAGAKFWFLRLGPWINATTFLLVLTVANIQWYHALMPFLATFAVWFERKHGVTAETKAIWQRNPEWQDFRKEFRCFRREFNRFKYDVLRRESR